MLTPNQDKLAYWISERENIRNAKETGLPKPWSKDPVFQTTYFTNVNREDDKVTKWIRENWPYAPDHSDTAEVYDIAMIVARIFNNPDTLLEIGQPHRDLETWLWLAEDILEAKRDRGERIWNGAYIISTNGKKMDKLSYCIQLIEKMCKSPNITGNCETLAEAHKELMKVEGLASFLAAQVVADLKNSDGHRLFQAPDWWTFSAPGPGSLRGLSWFWEEKITPKNYHEKIKEAMEFLSWEIPGGIMSILCMQNLQNCFCEFDKYMRVSTGTGRSKRRYDGANSNI